MNDRIFTASIVTAGPVHTGNGEPGGATDLPLHRDGQGNYYIPGTHIAGRLREIATRLAPALGLGLACSAIEQAEAQPKQPCGCRVCRVFGNRVLPAEGEEEGGKAREHPGGEAVQPEPQVRASRIWCFDAVADTRGPTLVRDGVGIERDSGAAAARARAKYDIEWIPAGTTLGLRIELEQDAGEEAERILALALSEWRAGRGRLGGSAARGGGRFTLEDCCLTRLELDAADQVVELLRQRAGLPATRDVFEKREADWLDRQCGELRASRRSAAHRPRSPAFVDRFARISLVLRFDGPVLVSDPAAGLVHGLDGAPVYGQPGWTQPILPGSSIRGVLRAQVERIARTVATRAAASQPDPLAAFDASCPACDPFRHEHGHALQACDRAAPGVEDDSAPGGDCLACSLFGNIRAGSRLWVADAGAVQEADGRENGPAYKLRDFVSIDRFTGGARERAKFDALPLYNAEFGAELLLWSPRPWEIGALLLALRDVHDGLTTIGSGGSRGFGRATVARCSVRLGLLDEDSHAACAEFSPDLQPCEADAADAGVFELFESSGTPAELCRRFSSGVRAFVQRCRQQRREPRDEVADTYFGTKLETLYGEPDLAALIEELRGAPAGGAQ